MHATDVAVIGGGQAGLAMSRCLSLRDVDHVVFERGDVAERWRSRTWDSLRLLTPNWLNGLPGLAYEGDDPDGFMPAADFAAKLRLHAAAAPVLTRTEVLSVGGTGSGFLVRTDAGAWRTRAVVIATGHCDMPAMPKVAGTVDPRAVSLHSAQYASPGILPPGGVLVVGASASGVQIADELRTSGRDVTIAVGSHTRLPRTWRGRDIHFLLHRTGMLFQRTLDLPDPEAAWREPAPQLAGRPDRAEVDLASLQARGVRLTGRLVSASGGDVAFADDLAASVGQAEAKQRRVLAQIDALSGIDPAAPAQQLPSVDLSRPALLHLDLRGEEIGTVIWATGYRRDFRWLDLPVHAAGGELAHRDGVASVPGIYALGFRLLRKRDSHFIGGVGADASFISDHICGFLGQRGRRAA